MTDRHSHNARKQSAQLREAARINRIPCCRCGQQINFDVEYPHPDSFSKDHFPFPLSTHPWLGEDPSNLAPACLRCNQSAGNRPATPGLGMTGQEW